MDAEGLIDQLHACSWLLHTYSGSRYWFSPFVSLLPQSVVNGLFEYDVRTVMSTGVWKNVNAYLLAEYGTSNPEALSLAQKADLVSNSFFFNVLDGSYRSSVNIVLSALEAPLDNPNTCAELLAQRSRSSVALASVLTDCKELLADCRANRRLAETPPDEFARQNWDLIQTFLDELSEEAAEARGLEQRSYQHLFRLARVGARHPLFATNYELYLSPRRPIVVADPIDHVVLESAKDPSLIRTLSPVDFEQFLARVFSGFGFNVEVTARSHDGGVDILCMTSAHGIPLKVAVQAKRYAATRPVSVSLVRSFVGANALIKANKLVYVTTSRYTKDAVLYATSPSLTSLLELKDFPAVVEWAGLLRERL